MATPSQARKAKCNRNTIYHRLKNPEFRDQLSAARKQVREGTISLCLGLMKEYCDSCRKDMKHKNAKTRREAREQVIKTFLGSLDRDALFQKFSAWLERQEQQGK